jgi:hypothetical protein
MVFHKTAKKAELVDLGAKAIMTPQETIECF